MDEDEITDLVNFLSENPLAGEELKGTGGCRKVRVAGRQCGRSGGYRTITFYTGELLPVFLITVFGKGEKATLTKSECNSLLSMTKGLVAEYKTRVLKVGGDKR